MKLLIILVTLLLTSCSARLVVQQEM